MSTQKKQHYVPKCYLKNFANNKLCSIYNQYSCKIIENISYFDQCQSDYFYGRDLIVENKLQEKESIWGNVFQKIINNDILTDKDIKDLKLFAIYQRMRTKAENDHINKMGEQVAEYVNNFNSQFTDSKYFIYENITPAEYLSESIKLETIIDDLDLLIIDYKTQKPLITSDAPVIVINPFYPSIGFSLIGLIIYFPVNPNKLIVLYDSKVYPKYKGCRYIESSDEKEVAHLNTTQYIMSDKIVLSKTPNILYNLGGKVEKLRIRNIKHNNINIMGNFQKQQIIHHSARKLYYEYEFSFGKLPKSIKQIPKNCRDMLPRQYDSKWAERILIHKPELMLELYLKNKIKIPDIKNKKQLLKGIRDMTNFVRKYWDT